MPSPHARSDASIPAYYDRFLGRFLFEPYAADLARRLALRPSARVLETACGTGIATRRLRMALPPGSQLVATDVDSAMLELARAKLAGADIHWRTADAQALPFREGVFDAVVCQFGLMLLTDKSAGFREARRVLAPEGVFLASVWCALADNPAADAVAAALWRLFPVGPPPFAEAPHGFHDPAAIEALARAAGFTRVAVERVELEGIAPSPRHVAVGFARGTPLAAALAERGADPEAVASAFADALGGDAPRPFRSRLAALVIAAT